MDVIAGLNPKKLREFALTTGALAAGLFGLFSPWLFGTQYHMWSWLIFAVLAVWGLAAPHTVRPFYRLWTRFGMLLGKIPRP